LGTLSKRNVMLLHFYAESPRGNTDAVARHLRST